MEMLLVTVTYMKNFRTVNVCYTCNHDLSERLPVVGGVEFGALVKVKVVYVFCLYFL